MQSQTELWTESRAQDHYGILGTMIRQELNRETVRRIDLSYLGNQVDRWWSDNHREEITEATRASLRTLILEALKPEHLELIQGVGRRATGVSAALLEHVFSFPIKDPARWVHESMAEISGLVDIKYPYEDHKELFPKSSDPVASDWGKGLGMIRPHSDDLYEERAVNAMCLTVCKDTSSTPTWFWMVKDVVSCLTDEELGYLALSEATYLSGKNVEGKLIEVRKGVIRLDPEDGLGMRLSDGRAAGLFERMRGALRNLKPLSSNPSTGSVSLLGNYKVLHGRSALNPVMLYEGESSRILFRSKGMK